MTHTPKPEDVVNDICDISGALTQWFTSQEIPPNRAVAAMCQLIAAMAVAGEGDVRKIRAAVTTSTNAIEVLALAMTLRKGC